MFVFDGCPCLDFTLEVRVVPELVVEVCCLFDGCFAGFVDGAYSLEFAVVLVCLI